MFGLSFAAPAFLLWSLAAVSPVIIHLIMREQPKRVIFPAVRFLQTRIRRQLRSLRLRQLLLLALRIFLIVALAGAMARPLLKGRWPSLAPRGGNVVVILDDSLSMLVRQNEATAFERAREAGRRFLRGMSASSKAAVMTTSSIATGLRANPDEALSDLAALTPQGGSDKVWPAISAATALLGREKGAGHVVLFTDMASNAWRGAEEAGFNIPRTTDVSVVPIESKGARNLFFSSAKLRSEVLDPSGRALLNYIVPVPNESSLEAVELYIDRKKQDSSTSPKGSFSFPAGRSGFLQGNLKIVCHDDLETDNTAWFTVAVAPPPRLLMALALSKEPTPLALAFGAALGGAFETVPQAALGAMRLSGFDAVVVEGLEGMDEKALEKLQEYVSSGGGLMVFPSGVMKGELHLPVDWRFLLPGFVFSAADAPKGTHLEIVDEEHPLARAFAESSFTDRNIRAPLFARYLRLGAFDEFDVTKVLAYSDGTPALLARSYGKGKSLFFAGAAQADWSDLVKHPSFVVLAAESLKYLVGRERQEFNFKVGKYVQPVLPASAGALAFVSPGQGEPTRLESAPRAVNAAQAGQYAFYALDGKAPLFAFSANVEPEESVLDRMEDQRLLSVMPALRILKAGEAVRLPASADDSVGELPAHNLVLFLILIVLAVEEFVANRFYRKVAEDE